MLVSVKLRKRGLLTRHFTRPRWSLASLTLLPLGEGSFRPAHWMRRMLESTCGRMWRRSRRAKVRTWSSLMDVGGGVEGGRTSKEEWDEALRW